MNNCLANNMPIKQVALMFNPIIIPNKKGKRKAFSFSSIFDYLCIGFVP